MSPTIEDHFDDLYDLPAAGARLRNMAAPKQRKKSRVDAHKQRKYKTEQVMTELAPQQDVTMRFSYKASRHEGLWLTSSLQELYENQWFGDVLQMVKGGKEASVYVCTGGPATSLPLVAAKVYRPRMYRTIKNDAIYREGRASLSGGHEITDKRALHAIHKRTEFGRGLIQTSWLEHEYKTMQILYEAGLDVPQPLASDTNAIVMSYFGDESMGAPTLNDVDLDRHEARVLFERVIHNIDQMLTLKRVHADLSAFNILYWNGEIVLIDFPQAINPDQNGQAYRIFERDVLRVCQYFKRQGVPSQPLKLATDLWTRHRYSFLPEVNHKLLDDASEDDRGLREVLRNR